MLSPLLVVQDMSMRFYHQQQFNLGGRFRLIIVIDKVCSHK